MWCNFCGQDVPGIASPKDGEFSCARCTHVIANSGPTEENASKISRESLLVDPDHSEKSSEIKLPVIDDDWQYEEEILSLKRIAKQVGVLDRQMQTQNEQSQKQINTMIHPSQSSQPWQPTTSEQASSEPQPSKFAWSVLLIGVMTLVCGGVLLIWSLVEQRQNLWDLGLPVTIAGQAAVMLGLILQMERFWRNSKTASDKLETVDQQINHLQHTAEILSTNSGPSNAFYEHLSKGASSELLLADLKGQMDLLTRKIAKQ